MSPQHLRAAACTIVVSLAVGGSAVAAQAADTTISVSPRVLIAAPDASPVDFPGVSKVRKGKPLPRGWVVVRRDVRIRRGGEPAFAALRMTCPAHRTWRSGASSGEIGASVLDRNPRADKRSVLVMATFPAREISAGETAAGSVLALCR